MFLSGFIGLTLGQTSCRGFPELSESDKSNDSHESAVKANAAVQMPKVDLGWCAKNQEKSPGHCLTIILRIPKPSMIKDIGLSILALAEDSKRLNPDLYEACGAGIAQYITKYAPSRAIPRPVLQGFARKFRYARCIVHTLDTTEDQSKSIALHPNEMAIDLRLTKFEITQVAEKLNASVLRISGASVDVKTGYRSVTVSSGTAGKLFSKPGEWLSLPALGMHPHLTASKFTQDLVFDVNMKGLKKEVENITTKDPKDSLEAAKSFLDQIKNTVLSQTPEGGAMVLIGMGIHAIKSLCGISQSGSPDPELCGYTRESGLKTQEVASNIELPSSENNELLRSAIIVSVASLIEDILKNGDRRVLNDTFQL